MVRKTPTLDEELRARDEFFEAAAHELRTPLSVLRLQLALLLEARQSASVPEHVRKRLLLMERQVDQLVRVTAKFTDVAHIARSSVPLTLGRVDLGALVRDVAARLEDQLRWAGCALSVDADAVWIEADAPRLDEAVGNLLVNAGKYAAGQPVRVRVGATAERATVSVIDRGPGIPRDMHDFVFEKFARGVPTTRSGLGLGLWISRRIVEAHGGTLTVGDTPGGGVTFVVDLPRERDAP